jgi:hypothetical protein
VTRPRGMSLAGWDEEAAALEAAFPGWHIWRSNAGRWWATRTGSAWRPEELVAGQVMTLDADDRSSLRGQLRAQTGLDGTSARSSGNSL